MEIVNIVNVSLLSNDIQNKLAEDYGLSDASQHMLAQTEDGKFFLFKDVHLISTSIPGAENDPKEVTVTIKSSTELGIGTESTVEKMMLLWQAYLKGEGHA